MKSLKRCLTLLLAIVMLAGYLPLQLPKVVAAAEQKPQGAAGSNARYKVEIVSFIRGYVDDKGEDEKLRCSELLEARIYKSTDGGNTWAVTTDVEGTPVSKLSYTWTNDSVNTPMVVFLSHDMTKVGIWGDTKEQTFQNGVSSTAVGGQWAAYKTPGVSTGTVGGWPGMGGWPGNNRPGSGSSDSTSKTFSGTATVQVRLPNGDVIQDSHSNFGQPDLAADLNNIALGLFIGESQSLLGLLGESAIVHITCSGCSVSDVRITDPEGCVSFNSRNNTVTGKDMGEATLSMKVSKEGCTVHNGQEESVSTKIFVFRKPETSTTTTTLKLAKDSLDERCRYYINGVEGTMQSDGILFTGLTPDTNYTVDVVATYSVQDGSNSIVRYAYAYVEDTTLPVYGATVNTYLDGHKVDIADIHGEDVTLYIKEANSTEYIYLAHTGTGTYSIGVENGIYDVYHKENGGFHKINDNHLVVANRAGSVDVHHYSVTYDPAGGNFAGGTTAVEVFASGKKVTAVNAVPTRSGYVFLGWTYGVNLVAPGAIVTDSITAPITLMARWEREVNVNINITIDHTYTDSNGNRITDSNNDSKDDVSVSLVARDDANSPYLEVPNGTLIVGESSHNGHKLLVNGTIVNNYAAAGTTHITQTKFEEDGTPTFVGLSAGKEYFVTVAKAGYSSTVTARKLANGDWVIDVNLKFTPESEEITFEVKMDEDVPKALYPEAVIVKVLYYNTANGTWEIIAQHANGNPGVRVPITGQTGNIGSFPVWLCESGETTPYYYRIMISAFIYKDGTIVPSEEAVRYIAYTDKNFTATVGNVSGGKLCGNLNGAYFKDRKQTGTLDATITLEAYDVTFRAEGGEIKGGTSAVAQDQYYIPDFDQYQPTMAGHTFLGWWYKDANGNYTTKAKDGELLTKDITLYALWDQTLEGKVTVDGTYELDGKTLTVWENDRATQAMIVLQQITSDTVNNLKIVYVPITWNGDVGISASYKFEGLDPMKSYRIEVIVMNYTSAYQNVTTPAGTFAPDAYLAIYTKTQPWETFVNGKLTFTPEGYKQPVEVDASQIGANFRPDSVMTQIWYTERGSDDDYKVITQHANGGMNVLIGADGKQNGIYAEEVWKEKFNGNLYDYQAYVSDVSVLDLPVAITYGAPSNFDTLTGQARNPLTVTLVPNKYNITFDLNTTGAAEDRITYYNAHTWSHVTSIPHVPTRKGYVFTGWKATKDGVYANGTILATVHEHVTLVAQWEKATITYEVEYYYDGLLKETDTMSARFEDIINPVFEQQTIYDGKHYALDYVVGAPLVIGTNVDDNVIKVYYGTDTISDESNRVDIPDGIPDYYQVTVTFEIVNGTWDETGDMAPITRVFTLYTQNPDRPWTKLDPAPAMGAIPEGTANANFVNVGSWTPVIPGTVERNATYTLAFNEPSTYSVNVIVVNGTAVQTGTNNAYASHVYTVVHGENLELNFTPNAEFALDSFAIDGVVTVVNDMDMADWDSHLFSTVTENHTIRVVYTSDTVGGGSDGNESDGVPDKYQKKITYKVVNGTWDGSNREDKVHYVTLTTDGKWDINGTAELPAVPTGMIANANFKKGTWDVNSFPKTVSGTDSITFTHTFKPTAYIDVVYTVEHYKQQSNGIFVLVDREAITIPNIELNAEEDGFEQALSAVTAVAKDYGTHYCEDKNHANRVAQGTPAFGENLTLKLYYALDSHTVRYDLNGGSAEGTDYSSATYLCGESTNAKEAAHKHGYIFQGWKAEDGTVYQVNDVIIVDKDIVLTAQWTKQTGLSYIVHYLEEDTNKVLKEELVVNGMTFEDVVNSLDHIEDIAHYLFVSADPEILTIDVDTNKNTINLYYTLDTVGGGNDGDDSDDVPDKYQKKVIFKVVNGTWDDGTEHDLIHYLTLMTNGQWDMNGTAELEIETGMIADEGYTNGVWDITPPEVFSGTDEVVYTFTFEEIPPSPPTGDSANNSLWYMLLLLSSAGMAALVLLKRKRSAN